MLLRVCHTCTKGGKRADSGGGGPIAAGEGDGMPFKKVW